MPSSNSSSSKIASDREIERRKQHQRAPYKPDAEVCACTYTHTRTYLECISPGPGRNTHFKNKAHCAENTLERRILNRRGTGRADRSSHRWRGGREAASQWHLCCAASLRMKFLEGSETLPSLPARAFCALLFWLRNYLIRR